jgi:hypothetical protein
VLDSRKKKKHKNKNRREREIPRKCKAATTGDTAKTKEADKADKADKRFPSSSQSLYQSLLLYRSRPPLRGGKRSAYAALR